MKTVQVTNVTAAQDLDRAGTTIYVWVGQDDCTGPVSRRIPLLAGESHTFDVNVGERVNVNGQ